MSATTKIAVAVASGYLLGRTKKLKLALTVGGLLAGRRVATNPQALLTQWSKLVEKNPELQKLQGQVTGKLVDAAKGAAMTTATRQIEGLSRSLGDGGRDHDDEEPEPAEDEAAEDQSAEEEPEEEEPAPKKKASSRSGGSSRKKAASSSAKKQPAKKSSGSRRSSASSRSGRSASRK